MTFTTTSFLDFRLVTGLEKSGSTVTLASGGLQRPRTRGGKVKGGYRREKEKVRDMYNTSEAQERGEGK